MNMFWYFFIIGVFVLLLDFIFYFMFLIEIIMVYVDDIIFFFVYEYF